MKWLARLTGGAFRRAPSAAAEAVPAAGQAADDWLQKGNEALQRGQLAEALEHYRRAAAADPRDARAWLNLGYAQLELGAPVQALDALDQAAALDGGVVDVPFLQGRALAALGRHDEAVSAFRRSIAVDPTFLHGRIELAALQCALARPADALRDLDAGLAALPGQRLLLEWRGRALTEMGRLDEAAAVARELVDAHPEDPELWSRLGGALYRQERFGEALAACERAVGLPGATPRHFYDLGCCRVAFNDTQGVQRAAAAGLALAPQDADLGWLQATAWLLEGDMQRGWPAYEARWHRRGAPVPTPPSTPQPAWDGTQDLRGRTLLVYAEQAFGDTIQFLRFLRPLQERGARLLLRIHPPLVELARGMDVPGMQVTGFDQPLPAFDLHCSLMSLPLRLGTTLATLAAGPYLRADPRLRARWEARLGPRARPRLGIAWSGKPLPDPNRTVRLAALLAHVPAGLQLVSLQQEVQEADRAALAARPDIFHAGADLRSFSDTAALADCMDAIVSIDTSVAHLVGALGKPLTVLLPYVPDWRWMLEREDSPWYASARLLRQDGTRSWAPVLARLRGELEALAAARA